jgi:DNA-binding response OmpR family regulator
MATTVCIIDDDELVCAQMAFVLRTAGFEVFEASSAKQGLQIVADVGPDVVLIDMIMPDRDGVETMAELRFRWPAMPIVAISGGGQIGPSIYLELARGLGARACLSKPLSIEAFKAAMVTCQDAGPDTAAAHSG